MKDDEQVTIIKTSQTNHIVIDKRGIKMSSSDGKKQSTLWNPSYIRVGIIAVLANTAIQLFVSAFPLYLSDLHFSPGQIGLVAGGYTICTMIMRVFSGNLIDTKGRRIIGILGIIIFAIPIVGFIACSVIALTIFLRMIQGFGAAATTITTGTMAADVATKERLVESIAYYGLFSNIATAIGPAIGIALIDLPSPNWLFFTALAVMIACFLLMNSMRYESTAEFQEARAESRRLEVQEEGEKKKKFSLWNFFEKSSLKASTSMFVISLATAAPTTFISTFAAEQGLSGAGLFFTIEAFFLFSIRLCSNRISRRLGNFGSLLLGFSIMTISFFLMACVKSDALLFLTAVLYGVGSGFIYPILNVLAVAPVPSHHRGKATSTYFAANDIGVGLGALGWGIIADAAGYRSVFSLAGAVALLCLPLAWHFFRPGRQKLKELNSRAKQEAAK